ncbi:uracil-DNA glycosylase, partial [Microbacterium sp. NPDC003461]
MSLRRSGAASRRRSRARALAARESEAALRAAGLQRPLADVRVLVVGQDPYPTPGHPIGLSF